MRDRPTGPSAASRDPPPRRIARPPGNTLTTDLIGWFSTFILILTVGWQAWTAWKSGSTQGLSRWLFVGQLAASAGFVVYSFLLGNIVFVVSNVFLLLIALAGQYAYLRNQRKEPARRGGAAVSSRSPERPAPLRDPTPHTRRS